MMAKHTVSEIRQRIAGLLADARGSVRSHDRANDTFADPHDS
ncbi:hypothetical protein SBA6_660013 [Candidatus Sulfopaludibacter sp. SbA6]|nr:hypothetical protein SBA6_660013 [Candidatus Sulfopaludibacter sp. SbA6]